MYVGTSTQMDHVLLTPQERSARGIELHEVGRGGDVTYHGPGQLIGYPILSLSPHRKDLHKYLRDLEEVLAIRLGETDVTDARAVGGEQFQRTTLVLDHSEASRRSGV